MPTKKVETDIRDVIWDWLQENDRTIGWLSTKTEIPYGTLYDIIKKKDFSLSAEKLSIIKKTTGVDFANA